MFGLVFVFDPRESEGYVLRCPRFLVGWLCRTEWARARGLDWWPTPDDLTSLR